MDKKYIDFVNENGEKTQAELLLSFLYNEKEFVIYTFNETDSNGMIVVYSSMVVESENGKKFEKILPEDWNEIKKIMNTIVKSERGE